MSALAVTRTAAPALTAFDRCDRCGACAGVQVILPSGGELVFCAHHGHRYETALIGYGAAIRTAPGG